MKRNKEKQAAYQAKYIKGKKTLSVLLDPKNDTDIISWLETQENRSEAVRRALRASCGDGRRRGHLIVTEKMGNITFCCTECRTPFPKRVKFCSNCGADLR